MLYKNKYSLPINDFISFQVTNYYNVKYSLFQNNGDGNINCIICAWSFCLVYDK